MRYLLLFRHAKSSWKDASLADHERPLNKRGKRDAPRMGRYIQGQGLVLDAILSSTAVRARATVEGFLEEFAFDGEVQYLEGLYHTDPDTILSFLMALPEEVNTVMVVGHNPGFDYFLELFCGEAEHMPTACAAYIRFAIESWEALKQDPSGELLQIWKPREI
jgi:phosphohistidine phosphatase